MSERYTNLCALPKKLYSFGAPVIIEAGVLLLDNSTGKVLAQLKIKSIDNRTIKAVKARIIPLDTTGKSFGDEIEYQYLDLNVERDDEFGQKTPIALKDDTTRSFSVEVCEVIFADNSIWLASGELWETMAVPINLDKELNDPELVKQYKLKYGMDCKYIPTEEKDLWICTCGAINRKEELICHSCNNDLALLKSVDLNALKQERDMRLVAENEKAAEDKVIADVKAKKTKKLVMIIAPILVVAIVAIAFISDSMKKNTAYNDAVSLLEEGEYDDAVTAFTVLGDYKDSVEQIKNVEIEKVNSSAYNDALLLLETGEYDKAVTAFTALGDYKNSAERLQKAKAALEENKLNLSNAMTKMNKNNSKFFAGSYHTIGLKSDGIVIAVGNNESNQCEVNDWKDIATVSAGGFHTVGLKSDGTVVAVGSNMYNQCEVNDWKDIVAISAGSYNTVGIKSDGTVVAVGNNEYNQCEVSDWKDIVAISAGEIHTVGLKLDGTFVAVGSNMYNQCEVNDWKDIVAISTGSYNTVGLKLDGTVVAVGNNTFNQCKVSDWKGIVAVSAGGFHAVGLKSDGTVVAVGDNTYNQCKVSDWKDIVAISAGGYHTVGLKSDGTVVAVGGNGYSQSGVSEWNLH